MKCGNETALAALALLVFVATPVPAALVSYTFTTGVTFTTPDLSTNNIECGTSDAASINLICSAVGVTGASTQTISSPGSLFYYIGSVQAQEYGTSAPTGPGIVASEAADPHNFIIGFTTGTDVVHSFSLTVPVTAAIGQFPPTGAGQFVFGTVSEGVTLGDGSVLTARIWYLSSLPEGVSATSFIAGSSLPGAADSFTWDSGEKTGFLFLEMNYDDSGIPEPATFVMLGAGLLAIGLLRFRKA
ncbi:MAG: PEP-CTERM sorting domain-containing protein [Bryobacteraceae bacterium]